MTTRPEKGADPAFAGRAGAATVTPCCITAGLASSDALLFLQFSPVSREAAFLPARIAGGAVVVLNGWPKAVPCEVSRVWVGLSRLGAEPLLRRGFGLSS